MIVLVPVYPFVLIIKEAIFVQASKTFEISVEVIEQTKLHVGQFFKVDLGLEAHMQIVLSVVLLLLANSETRTITGLEVLFGQDTLFYLPPKTALGVSISLSLYTCVRSHLRGISKKREYSTVTSTVLMLLFTITSIGLRVSSYILFLTPSLGLFETLRHLQGEMYPYMEPFYNKVNTSDDFHFGNAPLIPWSQISRWEYKGYANAEAPNYTLYSYFTIEQYFFVLIGILLLNMTLQMVVKIWTNPQVFKNLSWIDCLIHAISSCFIPHPMEEWDVEKGTVAMHRLRKFFVWKEMFSSIMVNFGVNLFLLIPLVVLFTSVEERQGVLVESIGAFPEEYHAYGQIKLMVGLGYSTLVILTILQVVTYYLYNGIFHPFAAIVLPEYKG